MLALQSADACKARCLKKSDCDCITLMKGQCYLRKQCNIPRCAKSGIASTYTYKNIYKNKFERKVPGIGGWGGSCRCPNGQVYQVGDSGKGCTALACINGKPGKCNRKQSAAWAGNKVTCATAMPRARQQANKQTSLDEWTEAAIGN